MASYEKTTIHPAGRKALLACLVAIAAVVAAIGLAPSAFGLADNQVPGAASDNGAASAATPKTGRGLDLCQPADYEMVNVFLSNFSEVDMGNLGSNHAADVQEIVRFAVMHIGLNSSGQWEYAPTTDGWPGIPGGSMAGGVNGKRNVRVSADRVQEIVQRYFGHGVDFSAIDRYNSTGWCIYEDGYVYFGVTNGTGVPMGVALAYDVDENRDGSLNVFFDVYGPGAYRVSDEGLYACSPSELKQRLGVDKPYRTGRAVVKFGDYNEYTGGLQLVAYDIRKY